MRVRPIRRVHAAGAGATAILLLMASAYLLTVEPAAMVGVRWRAGVTPSDMARRERRYALVRPREREDRTLVYDLLDSSQANIAQLVADRAVEDTSRIDRRRMRLPPDAAYGVGWTWIGYRIPILRFPGVTTAIVIACLITLILAFLRG